jgi:ABC-2 type transport system ATP-binding protein
VTSALIKLQALSKSYDSVQALDRIDAEVNGQIIGLLGPNGAGKSTLLKCLLGLVPFEGRAFVLGLPAKSSSFELRDRVGYMPEMDSYLANMSAVELCAYAAELSGLPKSEAMQRAHAALYYAGLEDKRYLKVEGYSTGMKQRVKLAQALVHDPELLFLDEPTNGLDPRARDDMLKLISELPGKRNCSVIISTHLLPDVDRICDHAVIMHNGQLRFSGTIEELRKGSDDSGQTYDVEVKDGLDVLAKELELNHSDVEISGVRSLRIRLPMGVDSRVIFAASLACDVQIRELAVQRESLESAFLRLLGAGL